MKNILIFFKLQHKRFNYFQEEEFMRDANHFTFLKINYLLLISTKNPNLKLIQVGRHKINAQ